jgi:hypothetical protein
MMLNSKELVKAIDRYEQEHPLTIDQRLKILDGLYEEAKNLGHFDSRNISQGIEDDIKIARIMNENV